MFVPPEAIWKLPTVTFNTGEILLSESTAASVLLFFDQGGVEVVKDGVTLTTVRERGAMFGEMSVLLRCPHTASVIACEETTCRVADEPEFYLQSNPDVMLYVSRILAQRLESLNRYLIDVKAQLREHEGHVSMVDDVLGALMNRHPRQIRARSRAGE
ncbi:MAG: hypothetical protein AMXMBFR84_08100 [Candidatus Hydrogenedentota bacterium]